MDTSPTSDQSLTKEADAQFGDIVPALTPVQMAPWIVYAWALLVVMAFAIITGWGRAYIGKNGEEVKSSNFSTE